MKQKMKSVVGVLFILFAADVLTTNSNAQLSDDYYNLSCPLAAPVIDAMVASAVISNPGLAPQLLRLHFHDCFVRGCDGSVLIFRSDHTAEMDGIPNKDSLKGFDFINSVKAVLEGMCPQTVSCADVVALAARDAVAALAATKGQFPLLWDVPLGRKDGRVSLASEANSNIPAPSFDYPALLASFATKGLSERQMVALSGAHTIGTANCTVSSNRLYNFTGIGDMDPTLNSSYVPYLEVECPRGIEVKRIAMKDQTGTLLSTNYTFDNYYFKNVQQEKGLFTSDAALITSTGARLVQTYAKNFNQFLNDFNAAMIAMGAIEVTTVGHVRTNCSDAYS